LVWYHSTRKAQIDAAARLRQVERALEDLAELEQKLGSPRRATASLFPEFLGVFCSY